MVRCYPTTCQRQTIDARKTLADERRRCEEMREARDAAQHATNLEHAVREGHTIVATENGERLLLDASLMPRACLR